MDKSFTEDEFLQELERKVPLLKVSMAYDFEHSKELIKVQHLPWVDIYLETEKLMADVLLKTIMKIIDLVYLDT